MGLAVQVQPGSLKWEDDVYGKHRVTLSQPFYLGVHEVTQGQWQAVMGTTPWKGQSYVKEGADYAATYVSWEDAVKFCCGAHQARTGVRAVAGGPGVSAADRSAVGVRLPGRDEERRIRLGTMRADWGRMRGSTGMRRKQWRNAMHIQLARRSRICLVCMTCTGTYKSGAKIGTTT